MQLNIIQGSDEWLNLRREHITGTDASIIMNLNPSKSADKLLRQKLQLEPEDFVNDKMKLGSELEPIARDLFCKNTDKIFIPSVHIHDYDDWMMCSTDGINFMGDEILEIKCGKKAYDLASLGTIPPYYIAQIQHNLAVTEAESCHYITYWEGNITHSVIQKDPSFINEMKQKELDFYNLLQETDMDYKDNPAWEEVEEKLIESKEKLELAKIQFEEAKSDAYSLITGKGAVGRKIRVTRRKAKTTVDYKSIPQLQGIDLTPYIKIGNPYWFMEFLTYNKE
jgi:putative phage-type endonuclease